MIKKEKGDLGFLEQKGMMSLMRNLLLTITRVK
jgi:hypothetical protein